MSTSTLSLVASFDDIVRITKVLVSGIEPEFIQFVRNQEDCRKKWLEAERRLEEFQDIVKKFEAENRALETKLKHARSQIDHEMKRRLKTEQERDSLERQVTIIRELLNDRKPGHVMLNDEDREKLSFLNNSIHHVHSSPSKRLSAVNESSGSCISPDISYDKTLDEDEAEDVTYLRNGRRWKRPSAPLEETTPPHKRNRSEHNTSIKTTVTTHKDGARIRQDVTSNLPKLDVRFEKPKGHKKRRPSRDMLKQNAEDSDDSFWGLRQHRKEYGSQNKNAGQFSTPPSVQSPTLRHFNSGSKNVMQNRNHTFVSKTVIRPETCIPCGKRIKFGKLAMKCKDCRATCHPDCKDQAPLPCIPTGPGTPGRDKGFIISDFTGNSSPMIPAILIHCVNEVEARGLTEVGIYRVPGYEKDVKDLKEKFMKGKGTPNLRAIDDIHVICGCIKHFLRSLKEPLVTYRLWKDIVAAAEMRDDSESTSATYQVVSQLPQSNRDTIAFLILHLQRVAECEECKMPMNNVAKVFGPTMIGYSCPEPEPMQMINETKNQQAVIERLMTIPSDYWCTFINVDDAERMYPVTPNTPESRPAPYSMLGPINTPGGRQESTGSLSKKAKSMFTKSPHASRDCHPTLVVPFLPGDETDGNQTTEDTNKEAPDSKKKGWFGSKSKSGTSKRTGHFFSSPMLK